MKHSAEVYTKHSMELSNAIQQVEQSVSWSKGSMESGSGFVGRKKSLLHTWQKKIATRGILYDHLRLVFRQDNEKDLSDLLGEKGSDGEVRVITSKKVLDALNGHFASSAKN